MSKETNIHTYTFNDAHDPTKPAQMWFEESHEGLVLFIVFYTLACRWRQCAGCNLPSMSSSKPINYKSLMAQVDALFADPIVLEKKNDIRRIILSNNGSVLDEETFSSTALMYFIAKMNMLIPRTDVLTIETRPEYIDIAELEFLSRALKEGDTPTELELAIGFEAYDNRIRNKIFKKGLSLRSFEEFAEKIAKFNCRLKCYIMQKPVPGMSDEEAVQDVKNSIDYLSGIATRFNLNINVHLNPTYAARGTVLDNAFKRGEYTPPKLEDVALSVRYAKGKKLSVYIGLFDEGLAVEGGSFIRHGDETILNKLEKFNKTQNFDLLD